MRDQMPKSKKDLNVERFPNWSMHWLKIKSFVPSSGAFLLIVLNDWTQSSQAKPRCRRSHKNVARRIKFVGNEINYVYGLPGNIPIIELDPLPTPYPPQGHIVLERPYSTLPPPPKKRDPTCSYLYKYFRLG